MNTTNYQEIPKAYNAQDVEANIYQRWLDSGYFNPDNLPGNPTETFSVMMPPVNVTGELHLGHAFEHTLMDVEVRFQRMLGKKALLIPGTDHAAVATQAKVEKNLIKSGKYKNPRQELGREKLLEIIKEFATESQQTILNQTKKLGTSADWSRLAYTFDEERSHAVNTMFKKMYEDGLIYRGYRVINWSIRGQSTCSDDELEYKEREGKMYTFKYSKDFPITIATTRPETKLGDTAVAVNPNDERYKKHIGQIFTVDVGAAKPLEIKIIADDNVDMDLGTGALGVTPAHSPIDFEMYENRLGTDDEIGLIQVIDHMGRMTANAGTQYEGLKVKEAREKFVAWLSEQNLLEKEEDIIQNVGTSDRFGDVVEALPMQQWFVSVNKKIPGKDMSLKDLMRTAVTTGHNGDNNQKVEIKPPHFEKIYMHWIDNLRDWCISRQIWWGHRIPIWYKGDETVFSAESPGEEWNQDEDTLDTWFSSALWTFSTLGWPNDTTDLQNYHPNSWMQMGHEILFFWMARMILMSTYALDEIPFKSVYIHGLLRDKNGQKFSKSLDNGIDPLDVIDQFGTDALRMALLTGVAPGADSKFYDEKVKSQKHLVNKVWNISRFIMMDLEGEATLDNPILNTLADKWIFSRLQETIQSVTSDLENYRFSQAIETLYEFTWHELADWYLEVSKHEQKNQNNLVCLLATCLKLLHPFMPFATEYIWSLLQTDDQMLLVQKWPVANKQLIDENAQQQFNQFKEIITSVRNWKAEEQIPYKDIREISLETELQPEEKTLVEKMTFVKITNSGTRL